ncbi:putative transposase [Palleronia aestuarii]|uniref:Putative transposase n=1 Tax=Palleronia aestuarii TaxID=568105 RepID=A0A2W7MX51_9RHOB|nr:putative transposase [Palleronia aestuarii]
MIEARHPALSITRQCVLIGISRSAWYGPGKGDSPLNLALTKLIDA